jgi:hypothetical protein
VEARRRDARGGAAWARSPASTARARLERIALAFAFAFASIASLGRDALALEPGRMVKEESRGDVQ